MDACTSGSCVGSVPPDCDDGNLCTQDSCDDSLGCQSTFEPLEPGNCLAAPKTALQVKLDTDPSKTQLKWKWTAGAAFEQDTLGTPETDTSYSVCVYDMVANVPSEALTLNIDANGAWVNKSPKGYSFTDKSGASNGVQKLQLKTGVAGKTKASLKASGMNLPTIVPASPGLFAQSPSVVVQIVNSEGMCLTSEFAPSNTSVNDGEEFKAKTP